MADKNAIDAIVQEEKNQRTASVLGTPTKSKAFTQAIEDYPSEDLPTLEKEWMDLAARSPYRATSEEAQPYMSDSQKVYLAFARGDKEATPEELKQFLGFQEQRSKIGERVESASQEGARNKAMTVAIENLLTAFAVFQGATGAKIKSGFDWDTVLKGKLEGLQEERMSLTERMAERHMTLRDRIQDARREEESVLGRLEKEEDTRVAQARDALQFKISRLYAAQEAEKARTFQAGQAEEGRKFQRELKDEVQTAGAVQGILGSISDAARSHVAVDEVVTAAAAHKTGKVRPEDRDATKVSQGIDAAMRILGISKEELLADYANNMKKAQEISASHRAVYAGARAVVGEYQNKKQPVPTEVLDQLDFIRVHGTVPGRLDSSMPVGQFRTIVRPWTVKVPVENIASLEKYADKGYLKSDGQKAALKYIDIVKGKSKDTMTDEELATIPRKLLPSISPIAETPAEMEMMAKDPFARIGGKIVKPQQQSEPTTKE